MAYIDKEIAIKIAVKKAKCNNQFDAIELVEAMEDIPTADVVEVVRCKDCKFNVANMEKDPLNITDYSGDDIVCSYFLTDGLDPNDYCSRGTRMPKEGGGEK